MERKTLFIEGTSNQSNGALRQGFYKLLKQVLERKMPKIVMGDSKSQAVTKFQRNTLSTLSYLLIDLDKPENSIEKDLMDSGLEQSKDEVFYMIQEMEAWFISQPQILDEYYKAEISSKLPKTNPKYIKKPSNVLERVTKNTQKGKYHKVRHGTALLELLDANSLKESSEQFSIMISKLSGE